MRREAEAVSAIVERAESGQIQLIRSPAHLLENDRNPREDSRLAAALWIDRTAVDVALSDEVQARARDLVGLGFGVMDALHLAFAEAASADWFVTCDDRLTKLGIRLGAQVRVAIVGPNELPADQEA